MNAFREETLDQYEQREQELEQNPGNKGRVTDIQKTHERDTHPHRQTDNSHTQREKSQIYKLSKLFKKRNNTNNIMGVEQNNQ